MNDSARTASRATPWRVLLSLSLLAATAADAQLKIEVSSGVTDPIPIAIVPFQHAPSDGGFDLAAVVQHDLEGSGRFHAMPRERMKTSPARVENVEQADWKADGNDYVAVGRAYGLRRWVVPGDRMYTGFPMFHTSGQQVAFMSALVTGASIAIDRSS